MSVLGKLTHSSLGGHVVEDAEIAVSEVRQGRFQRSMAVLTAFPAIVSGFEAYVQHQRGGFSHWLMWTPVWLTPPTVATSAAALFTERAARRLLPAVSLVSLADGVIGFVFHVQGILKMPGGFKLGQYNIVMGPPIFAPLLTCIVGLQGLLTSALRREQLAPAPAATLSATLDHALARLGKRQSPVEQLATHVAHGRFQRGMALTSAFFSVLAGGEAYFEHLCFNITMGPPLFAPLLLSSVGLLGFLATLLRRKRDEAGTGAGGGTGTGAGAGAGAREDDRA